MKYLLTLFTILTFVSVSFAQQQAANNRLFIIERSKNANVVCYDANMTKDGKIDKEKPVDAYWIMYAENAGREEISAFEKIKKVIGAHLEFVQHTPALHSLIFSRELHAQNDLLRQAFNSMASDFNNLLAELSRQAQIDRDLSCVFTPQEIASLLLTLASGLATRWSLGGRTFDLATESRRLLEILLHGMHGAC